MCLHFGIDNECDGGVDRYENNDTITSMLQYVTLVISLNHFEFMWQIIALSVYKYYSE